MEGQEVSARTTPQLPDTDPPRSLDTHLLVEQRLHHVVGDLRSRGGGRVGCEGTRSPVPQHVCVCSCVCVCVCVCLPKYLIQAALISLPLVLVGLGQG